MENRTYHRRRDRHARQHRALETERRLRNAACALMATRRADQVTVAQIAAAARTSVGNFYRRFESKEIFLENVRMHRFWSHRSRGLAFVRSRRFRRLPLQRALPLVVREILRVHARERALLRDFRELSPKRDDPFVDYLTELADELYRLLRRKRPKPQHPDLRAAVSFGLKMVEAVAADQILFGRDRLAQDVLDDQRLVRELSRALASYLGVPN